MRVVAFAHVPGLRKSGDEQNYVRDLPGWGREMGYVNPSRSDGAKPLSYGHRPSLAESGTMNYRVWCYFTVGILGLIAGVLVFMNFLNAKPPKEDSGDPAARKAGAFDGDRALAYLIKLCDLGPRISGSDAMKQQQDLLEAHFTKHGATVAFQKFDGRQPSQAKAVGMANMVISWHPESKTRVILCGHYDTRPIADQERNTRDWRKPFLSANDGTSTVAWMMELAHQMKDLKTAVGVDFVIFDGEEWINDVNRDRFFLGSQHFGAEYKKAKGVPKYQAAINLDLFAGPGATYPIEQNSKFFAGELVEDFWKVAADLGEKAFRNEDGPQVQDDHIALNAAGIPCIDIIDFDYPHWHKLTDVPSNCSAESMATVAKVVVAWLQKVK